MPPEVMRGPPPLPGEPACAWVRVRLREALLVIAFSRKAPHADLGGVSIESAAVHGGA